MSSEPLDDPRAPASVIDYSFSGTNKRKEDPMPVARMIRENLGRASWIRRTFEEGQKLREKFGADRVFDFSLGNPDIEPPPEFRKELIRILNEGGRMMHGYMPNAGYPFARAAVARKVSREHACEVRPEHVVLTVGAAGGLNALLHTILDPGDEVIVPKPHFGEYYFYIANHGGMMVNVDCAAGFELDPARIAEALTPRTAAVLINTPNNPTGRIYRRPALEALARVLADHGKRTGRPPLLAVDEPYRDIVYDGRTAPPILDLYPETAVVSSWSKTLSIPGERIGYVAVSPRCSGVDEMMDGIVMSNRVLGFVNAPALMQRAVAALGEKTSDLSSYARRRDALAALLQDCGIAFAEPEGTFYLFCRVPEGGLRSSEEDRELSFCQCLRDENILAVPGIGFGYPGWFRLSYCVPEKTIEGSAPAFRRAVLEWRR